MVVDITLDGKRYLTCGSCKEIHYTPTTAKYYVCSDCRHTFYKKVKRKKQLTNREHRVMFTKILQKHLDMYFKSMRGEYEIKNKR